MENTITIALIEAIKLGDMAESIAILRYATNPNTQDDSGQTPLMLAAEKGYKGIVKLLLEKNANPNTQDNLGRTPLMLAAEKGYKGIVKLLLENGADPSVRDQNDCNAEAYALAGAFLSGAFSADEHDAIEEEFVQERSFGSLLLENLLLGLIEPENKIKQEFLDAMAAIAARDNKVLVHIKYVEDNEHNPVIENITNTDAAFIYHDFQLQNDSRAVWYL